MQICQSRSHLFPVGTFEVIRMWPFDEPRRRHQPASEGMDQTSDDMNWFRDMSIAISQFGHHGGPPIQQRPISERHGSEFHCHRSFRTVRTEDAGLPTSSELGRVVEAESIPVGFGQVFVGHVISIATDERQRRHVTGDRHNEAVAPTRGEIRAALETDQTIDIVTIGARTGHQRTTEIWFTNVSGRIIICGTPGAKGGNAQRSPRDWLANLTANPDFHFCLKESVQARLTANATAVTEMDDRWALMVAPQTQWYRDQVDSVEHLVREGPIVEVTFTGAYVWLNR